MTGELERVAKAIRDLNVVADSYAPEIAQAAIAASDSPRLRKEVEMLREALNRISTHYHINHDGSLNAGVAYSANIAKEALAATDYKQPPTEGK